ncbi:hypothetical protein EMIHUDRAFT_249229 [Emiliania huxleyi CCMP1516]|uniref:Uncharacterized protein n=2 Tax=Emiliania huxleyi TaxID=2903 RepID=A0A0D3I9Y2_EMIH1|nr:hypothetical protein EMIHUDRAFT_249229 [Emiliania huxleyi CCMP1516]EOD08067.1 hypothetical protein EMIHUDRAFT_249229 [Emiliania huxleyi CCMP1516]|eukprot:XP_005760496.1 hypothetical protein EMIHUDRAFT_249229 [Emiliania huxleyi CCMP1516]
MPVTLEAIDITLIALYFVGMAAVGIIFWARGGGDGGGQDEAESFFLAGRSMRWPAVGLSLFVSNVGSEHLLGLAGSASATGVACAYFEWSAALHLLLLGWLFAPVYLRCGIATLPEYLGRRYGPRLRRWLSLISLVLYLLTKLSVSIYSAATVLTSVFGWPRWIAAAGLVGLTACYTAVGGLAAVIVTDVAQSVVMLVGAVTMTAVGFGREWSRFFHIYKPPDDPSFPTLGMLLGQHAAVQACGIDPGIIARKLFDAELYPANGTATPNQAFPLLLQHTLPPGLLGLNLAAAVAACMSSLDSVFTAAASLFCLDLYRGWLRPAASPHEAFCALLAVLTLLWLPIIDVLSDQIFLYKEAVMAYLAPPIVSVYLLGPFPLPRRTWRERVLWRRANATGAAASFAVGYTLGFGRMAGEVWCKLHPPRPGSAADALFVRLHFLYAGLLLCLACLATHAAVSWAAQGADGGEGRAVDETLLAKCSCGGEGGRRAAPAPKDPAPTEWLPASLPDETHHAGGKAGDEPRGGDLRIRGRHGSRSSRVNDGLAVALVAVIVGLVAGFM